MNEHLNSSPEEQQEQQQQEMPAPEYTEGSASCPKGQEECPSIFDKPDPDRYAKSPRPRKRMSRQVRNVIISLALCVAIVLSASGVCRLLYHKGLIQYVTDYFTAAESDPSSTVSEEDTKTYIFDYSHYERDSADTEELALGGIKNIVIRNQADTYTLESHWGTELQTDPETYEETQVNVLQWLITHVENRDIDGVKFSTSTVGFIVTDLLKISYDSVYAEDGNEEIPQGGMTYYDECGITDSKVRCTVNFGNGASATVILGDPTPTGNNYFVALDNNPGANASAAGAPQKDGRIYKVGADAVAYFTKEASYFVEKEIVAPVEQAESTYDENGDEVEDPYFISGALSYFDALSISGLAYPKDFVFKIVQEDQPGYDSIYLMTSPYTQNVDLEAMDTLLAPVADGLSAAGCLVMKATDADIAKYGLDEPACVVRYVVKNVEYILKIGSQVDRENDYYAVMVNDNPSIMEVSSASLAFKDYDEADFASDTLYSCDITEIQTIRVELEDGTDELFRLTHGEDANGDATLKVTARNGRTVDEDGFRDMYVNLLSLTSFTNVTDGKDAAHPYLTVTLTYNRYDQTDVIRLSPYTDRRYFMSLNGMGSTVVLSTAVEAFTDSLSALLG